MKLLDKVNQLFTRKQAEESVKDLNRVESENGGDWIYKVDHDPAGTGYSRIAIYEKGGEFVAYF